MAQVISTNSLSLLTQNNMNKSQSALGTAIERLSSGLRINSAKDDAAGQAIANRFTANIKGLTQASRNANDGISIAQTTEGALNEINNNLQRVRELSVQASNGTNSGSDLKSIQDEIDQRLNEINRVADQTDFNGKKVLKEDSQLTIQVGAKDNEVITIDLKKIDKTVLGLGDLDVTKIATTVADKSSISRSLTDADFNDTDTTKVTAGLELYTDGTNFKVKDTASGDTFAATFTGGKYEFASTGADTGTTGFTKVSSQNVTVDAGALTTGQSLVKYDDNGSTAYAVKTEAAGVVTYDKTTIGTDGKVAAVAAGAAPVGKALSVDPMAKIDDALKTVDAFRSQLGAVQNRFESAITNLGNTVNNLTSARSRIEDADYATEVSNMSRAQILQQAGTSVLAQANQVPQGVLSLLR